jgi:hypothetical protein
MKSLVKRAAVALAAVVGISNAAAGIANTVPPPSSYPDHTTEDAIGTPQVSGETGLSFEDLRVNAMGKVPVEVGSTEAPVRVAADSQCCPITNSNC